MYSAHSSPPWCHSYIRPSVSKVSRAIVSVIVVVGVLVFMLHGIGSRRMISKSNKINRMATRKN